MSANTAVAVINCAIVISCAATVLGLYWMGAGGNSSWAFVMLIALCSTEHKP